MNNSQLSINRLVNVGVNYAPNAAQMQNISNLLILGTSNIIDTTQRFRLYSSDTAVSADFGTTSEEYLCAVLWFEQNPQPTQLMIGRWANAAFGATLKGATLSTANAGSGGVLASWTSLTAAAFETVIDNVPLSISLTGTPFSGATAITGVASVIQTALQAAATTAGYSNPTGITCVWNSVYNRFEVNSGTTGVNSTLQYLDLPAASGFFNVTTLPLAADTITLNGTVWTFVSAITAGNQILIGASIATTLTNAVTALKASADVNTLLFDYYTNGNYLYTESMATGAAGNAYTLAESTAGVRITKSGAVLTGGASVTYDISVLSGMSSSTTSGVYISQGQAAETAKAAANLFDNNYGQSWYGLFIPDASDKDHVAVGNFIDATTNKHTYFVSTLESGALVATNQTDIAAILSVTGLEKTLGQYSSSNPYAVVSAAAKALTIDYSGNNTVIDLMYKQEPGIVAEALNASQITALENKNFNVFIGYNNDTAIFEPGNNVSGSPFDIITGTDWLALDIQTAVYNLLYLSQTKIPQTDAGNHMILTTIESVLSQAVTNGLLAPGTWTTGGFGELNQGDFLPKGFYVYAPPIATQSSASRSARQSVIFQIAAKMAGAIRYANIQININR